MVKMAGWQNWPDVETDCEGVSLLVSSAVAVYCTGLIESAAAADIRSNKTALFNTCGNHSSY